MKIEKQKTIGDEIAEQIVGIESTFTIRMSSSDGYNTAFIRDDNCSDLTIIQESGENVIKTIWLSPEEVEALSSMLI